jgi:hypothetical protein
VATHTSGILTVGTGDLRVTTAGTNTASVVTVGGTQTLTSKTLTSPVIGTGLSASGSAANDFSASTGTFLTSSGANTLSGDVTIAAGKDITFAAGDGAFDASLGTGTFKTTTGAHTFAGAVTITDATTPSLTTASGKTNTGFLLINGKTSGSLKLITADATAQALVVSGAAQTSGTATISIPDLAGVNHSFMVSSLTTNTTGAANSVTGASNSLVYEGTADAHEIVIDAADATADVIYRLANAAAGTYGLMSTSLATNALDAASSVTGTSNGLVAEGTTADGSETTLSFADPSADTTQTIPAKAVSGTVETLSVQDEPATDTITAGQLYGGVITNTGAVGAAVYTLPAPAVGMHFRVYLTVAQDVDINPADGTQILALTNATGDAISSAATIGNCIELIALSTTTWAAFAVSGTWTDVN